MEEEILLHLDTINQLKKAIFIRYSPTGEVMISQEVRSLKNNKLISPPNEPIIMNKERFRELIEKGTNLLEIL